MLELQINFKVRTEESEQFSLPSVERQKLQISADSVYIAQEAVQSQNAQNYKQCARSTKSTHRSSTSLKSSKQMFMNMKTNERLFSAKQLPPNILSRLYSYKKCPNIARTDIHNRAYGAMLGVLIGDVLGSYLLNKPPEIETIGQSLLMNGGGVMDLRVGQGSDEWQINMALAQGLLAGKGAYDRQLIASKYLEWIESNPHDLPVLFGIAFSDIRKCRNNKSRTCSHQMSLGQSLLKGSQRNSKQQSALGLQRLIPLVIWAMNLQDHEFNLVIRQEMKLIISNEFVTESAVIFAIMIRTIITTGDTTAAYYEAASAVCRSGNQKLIELWNLVEQHSELNMNVSNANHLKFPFCFAVWEMMKTDSSGKDPKKQFIDAALRVLSRGFSTDVNCSIVLGVVGACLGYNSIPNYFRDKILKAERGVGKRRTRQYWSGKAVDLVNELMKEGPIFLDER